jgi:hypothetical protein
MDRAQTLHHLEQAQGHVSLGIRRVAAQQQIVDTLERGGHHTIEARRLLVQFQNLLALDVVDRNRLRAELNALEGSKRP